MFGRIRAARLALCDHRQGLDVLNVAWSSGRLLHPDEVVHTDYVHGDPVEVGRQGTYTHPCVRGGTGDIVQDVQLPMSGGERRHDRGDMELLGGGGRGTRSELDRVGVKSHKRGCQSLEVLWIGCGRDVEILGCSPMSMHLRGNPAYHQIVHAVFSEHSKQLS
jgi:hypothetical protein